MCRVWWVWVCGHTVVLFARASFAGDGRCACVGCAHGGFDARLGFWVLGCCWCSLCVLWTPVVVAAARCPTLLCCVVCSALRRAEAATIKCARRSMGINLPRGCFLLINHRLCAPPVAFPMCVVHPMRVALHYIAGSTLPSATMRNRTTGIVSPRHMKYHTSPLSCWVSVCGPAATHGLARYSCIALP